MKKLGKLKVNPEKIMGNEELKVIKGGYSGVCGGGVLTWWIKVWYVGFLLFEGYACGTQDYIKSTYPMPSYSVDFTGPF